MKITKNLPRNLNHQDLISRIKQNFGLDVGISATHNDDGSPSEIVIHSSVELPADVIDEIQKEPDKTVEQESEERQLQQGPLKKLLNRIEALETENAAFKARLDNVERGRS